MENNSQLLANIFQMVTKTLAENQQTLNAADEQNHDHGNNMVQTFQTITRSIQNKKDAPGSSALAFAAQNLSKEATSGSGKLYAQGLAKAADQFKGKPIDAQTATQLLQTLIGGGQSQQAATQPDDLLGALLGGLSANEQTGQNSAQPASNDMPGSLLGGLTGSDPNAGTNGGLDAGDLLNAGMAFLQAKQSGGSNAEAVIQALVAGSGMGDSAHRAQSTQLVTSSFLQALGTLGSKS